MRVKVYNMVMRYTHTKPRPNYRNISTQHIATLLGATCCTQQWAQYVGRNMLRAFGHRFAMCCDMLSVVGSSFKMVTFEPTTPNTSQHVATGWSNARYMLRPTMLRNVALTCCNSLPGLNVRSCVAEVKTKHQHGRRK